MEPRTSVIEKRLKNVKKIISVASGKGGVGKSLVASALALNLAKKGKKVGLLDLDLYGPSSHIILGLKKFDFPEEENGIIPPKIKDIKFMSIVIFSKDKPSAFRGIDITNIIIELLAITQWGKLDYLIIDMPPGIGDETLDVINLIKDSSFLVVTTPSKVSMGAVNKLLLVLNELKLSTVGVIENMVIKKSSYVQNIVKDMNVKYLGLIDFDKNLEESIGNPYLS
jgi:ATP-binding protein involved in chromosome partitioning